MVRVSVMDEDTSRDELMETGAEDREADLQEAAALEDHGKKDIPLTKMTKAQLIEKVEELQESSQKERDLYLRSQAEIDNLKKRHQKDREGLVKFANESLIKQLLPVADNLEKAVAHSQNEASVETLREGVDLTLKGLVDVLQKAGVETIEAVGEQFDPNFHEAVSEMVDDRVEPGTVLKDLQKGYTLNQRLVRPSMVIVSKKTA
ncbi:MAG: nucleotide exchange factor GrpE [Proteobacteria bacterium]|nr:nucleotide exchange factor GrpE [Desulfobacterales bacterium]MBL7171506.1 nucleotide exchange factor GrpE [Desulfobacteraceae bacterium]MBU0733282.1 nucleotide exchange factor GrpE [Pseudomonadota bacterium]MBU1903718.1 nucleotide exchange factor GrpE [Pseudomonadota bacterium]